MKIRVTMSEELWDNIKGMPHSMCEECSNIEDGPECDDCAFANQTIFHSVENIEEVNEMTLSEFYKKTNMEG